MSLVVLSNRTDQVVEMLTSYNHMNQVGMLFHSIDLCWETASVLKLTDKKARTMTDL